MGHLHTVIQVVVRRVRRVKWEYVVLPVCMGRTWLGWDCSRWSSALVHRSRSFLPCEVAPSTVWCRMHACTHTCMHARTHTCTHTHPHIHAHTHKLSLQWGHHTDDDQLLLRYMWLQEDVILQVWNVRRSTLVTSVVGRKTGVFDHCTVQYTRATIECSCLTCETWALNGCSRIQTQCHYLYGFLPEYKPYQIKAQNWLLICLDKCV